MDEKLITAYEYLAKNHQAAARDICDGLELFADSLGYGIEAFQKDISDKNNSKDFSGLMEIAEYVKTLTAFKETMEKSLADISMLVKFDESDVDSTTEEDEDEKALPNYKDYVVDDEIPHTLSEVFTHKKICGFMLDGVRYNVKTWQEGLIRLGELLIEKDEQKFHSFLEQPAFKGRKNNYLSATSKGNKYYHKLTNAGIYVWTNLSTAMICEIMKKILRGYGIPVNSLYIYLRADYTPLHIIKADVINSNNENPADKIGKYVRTSMRTLSNDGYSFSQDMLSKLTNGTSTKALFGIGIPFLKELKDDKKLSAETKDTKSNARYWKEVFEFNGKKYLIVSQWHEGNRERFENWRNSL